MNYQGYTLRPADRLIAPIFATGITQHHAIYVGQDAEGMQWLSENDHTAGVRLIRADHFLARYKTFRVLPFIGTTEQRDEAVRRAYRDLGKPYDLLRYNCEHHSSFVQTGRAISRQVQVVMGGMLLLILWLSIAGTNK